MKHIIIIILTLLSITINAQGIRLNSKQSVIDSTRLNATGDSLYYYQNGVVLSIGAIGSGSMITGTGTVNYLPKFTGTKTLGNSLIYDNGTNVGIGTSSLDRKLSILVSPLTTADDGITITNGVTPFILTKTGSAYTYRGVAANAGMIYSGSNIALLADGSNITFHNGNGQVASIESNGNLLVGTGNVGIGTNSPYFKLQMNGGAAVFASSNFDVTTTGGSVHVFSDDNNGGKIWALKDGNQAWGYLALQPVGGNVGIGTTFPQSKLDVVNSDLPFTLSPLKGTGANIVGAAGSGVGGGDGAASGVLNIIDNATMAANNGGTITLGGNYILSGNSYALTYAGIKGGKENALSYNSAGYLALYTTPDAQSPVERMRITSSGNVGIGETNPNARLQVNLTNFPSTGGTIARFAGGTTTPTSERFIEIAQTYTGAAFDSPMLVFRSNTDATNNSSYSTIRGTADGATVFSNVNNAIAGVSAASERMRITSVGNVGIGDTNPDSKLEVNGSATNTNSINTSSDTINYSLSNIAYTDSESNSITLTNIKDGGAYTLISTATNVSSELEITATNFDIRYMGTVPRTYGKRHIYSFIVAGTDVYVTMGTQN